MTKQIILVTGGGTGIGQAICEELSRDDRYIYIHYGSSADGAKETLAKVEAAGGSGEIIQADLADDDALAGLIATVKEKSDRLDILVNNAGVTEDALLVRMTDEMYDKVIQVNQKTVFVLMREAAKIMMSQRFGKIINIISVVGLHGNFGQTNYAASKAAVFAMSKTVAKELATRNITVNCIAPGFIETKMTDQIPEKITEKIRAQIPMGEFGQPSDIAKMAKFLASSDADYITGQSFSVDGGMNM